MPITLSVTEVEELFILIFAIYFNLIIDRANTNHNPYDTYKHGQLKVMRLKTVVILDSFTY